MKYRLKAPASLTEYSFSISFPDLPESLTPEFSGVTPIPEPNQAPEVFAGNDIEITLPENSVTLVGSAKDPDGSILSVKWSQTLGQTAIIVNPNQQTTVVSSLKEGDNEFVFEAFDDKGLKKTDSVIVKVKPAPVTSFVDTIFGFGSKALGGEGKQIIEVDETNFISSIGSNRILRFKKSCTVRARINLRSISYLTIDANGFDVIINNNNNGDGLSFDGSSCHHNIVKGLTVYNAGNDGINVINGAHDIAIVGCFSYGNRDGNIDIADGYNITVQDSLTGPGANGYSGSMLITAKEVSVYRCGHIKSRERNPMVHCNYSPVGSPNADIVNNLIWEWEGYGIGVGYNAKANVVNNYLYSSKNPQNTVDNRGGWGQEKLGYVFASGNFSPNTTNTNSDTNMAEVIVPDWAKLPRMTAKEAALFVKSYPRANQYAKELLAGINIVS